jgi:ribosomal protein S11
MKFNFITNVNNTNLVVNSNHIYPRFSLYLSALLTSERLTFQELKVANSFADRDSVNSSSELAIRDVKNFHTLSIKFTTNNMYIYMLDLYGKLFYAVGSPGGYGIKVSRKNKRHNLRKLIQLYCNELVRRQSGLYPIIMVRLALTIRMRKKVIRWLEEFFFSRLRRKKQIIKIYDFIPFKAFNGCRARIFRRKKRLRHYTVKAL